MGRATPLLVYAAPREAALLVARGVASAKLLELGVGKVAAASRLTQRLVEGPPPNYVLGFGVAGAYRDGALAVGDVCVVREAVLADEGVDTPDGFLDLDALGLGTCGPFVADPRRSQAAATLLQAPLVRAATVSRCSGTNPVADELAQRTDAEIETMESAAVASVCQRLGVPWIELRAISNFTGDRSQQAWQLDRAVANVTEAVQTWCAHDFVD